MEHVMTATSPITVHSRNEGETAALAAKVANSIKGGDYVSLEGDLGAGKTLFARELARALGITGSVSSPTFVLQKYYPVEPSRNGISKLAHYDFYRISNYHELLDLGFEDHDSETVVLAEWGDLFLNDFPVSPVRIRFSIKPDDHRLIEVHNLILR